jgi:tetratricopeptide (TPR) repeat protein
MGLAFLYAGQIRYAQKDFKSAEQLLLAAVQADEKSVEAHRHLMALYFDSGAMDHAIYHCEQVQKLVPTDMRPWRLAGLILKDFERFDEAVKQYEGALARTPPEHVKHEISIELAEFLFQLRRQAEALEQLQNVPETGNSLGLAAECHMALGQSELANSKLVKSLSLDPNNLRGMSLQSTLLLENGEIEQAQSFLEKAVASHPFELSLRSMLTQVYERQNDTEKAKAQQEQVALLRSKKDNFTKLHIRAIRDPNDVEARVELARLAIELGMLPAAANWYEAALSLNPGLTSIATEYRELLAKINASAISKPTQ